MKEKETTARYNAQDLICDKCVYIGQIKDGRESFYCDEMLPTILVIDKDYTNYTSGLHLSNVFKEEVSNYCVDEAMRLAYRKGIFSVIIKDK